MSLGERLKVIRGKISQKEFGEMFGAAPNSVRKYENNEGPPNTDFILSVCEHYNINPIWLLVGEGSMYKGKKTDVQPDGNLIQQEDQLADPREFDMIPMVETKLSAGGGAFVVSEKVEGYYAFRKSWVRSVATSAKSLVLMRVDGDSMYPNIHGGDTVMIDTNRKDIIDGQIYAIRFDSTVMIKRLTFRPGNRIMITSDNKQEFEAYDVDRQELHLLGQIIFFSRVLVHD